MTQVTLEGSHVTPSTFLGPGQRVTVEHTKYIQNLIRRGYVNVIRFHEPIHESAPVFVKEPDPNLLDPEPYLDPEDTSLETVAGAAFGAPPSNALKSVWVAFLAEKGVEYPEGSTKLEMIRIWNQSEEAYGKPVD